MKILAQTVIVLCLVLLAFDSDDCPPPKDCNQDFEYFILIEYDKDRQEFELISDMLDKSVCMDAILDIECLREQPLQKDRVEKISLKIEK